MSMFLKKNKIAHILLRYRFVKSKNISTCSFQSHHIAFSPLAQVGQQRISGSALAGLRPILGNFVVK